MTGDRLLSEEEIAEAGQRTIDRLLAAIDRGDRDEAGRLARRMYGECLAMHDLYRDKVTALKSFIARNFGDAALERALLDSARAFWLPILRRMPAGPEGLRARVKMFIAGLRGHLQPLRIREEADRIVVQMHPCGSGGRLIQEGRYDGPEAFVRIGRAQRITFGRSDYPVYCAHEAPMELADIEAHGAPFVVVEPGERLGQDPCSFIIYKDPARIPAHYYERLGLTPPARGEVETRRMPPGR
jgi:hypothetical protein